MNKETYQKLSELRNDSIIEFRVCAWTGEEFPIYQSDVEMLAKLSPVIGGKKYNFPLPRLSPKARQIQRILGRNEWNFHHLQSSKSGKKIVSIYASDSGAKVYEESEWWKDDWDPMDYGKTIDQNNSTLGTIAELRNEVPRLNIAAVDNENSDYTSGAGYCKDCYLINCSENAENCLYGKMYQRCNNCVDCCFVFDSELLYQCMNVKKSYGCTYLYNSTDCSDCHYSEDLVGCNNCIFSSNLRNASYVFENNQLTKQKYEENIKAYHISRENIQNALKKFEKVRKGKTTKYAEILNSTDSYGDYLTDNKNCMSCFDVVESEDCRYLNIGVGVKDIMDGNNVYIKSERCYNFLGGLEIHNSHCSQFIFRCSNIFYSQDCYDSHNLFGCMGLRNKEYCIFNTQYTKQEWGKEVSILIKRMQKNGEWGEFFPSTMSALPYNDSLANEYFPIYKTCEIEGEKLKNEQIIIKGGKGTVYIMEPGKNISKAKLDLGGDKKIDILWKTKTSEINIPQGTQTKPALELKNTIEEESEDITKIAIICKETGRPFRITPYELHFYKKMKLPIPQKHPDSRYYERLGIKPDRELYARHCGTCKKDIISVYPSSSPIQINCETCYNTKVG